MICSGCSKQQENDGSHTNAREINCVNNLTMVGTTLRYWAHDHGDKFPFQVSTNAGGTLELVLPDNEGFDRNAFMFLKAMRGDEGLATPLLLICPHDKSKKAAANWIDLGQENVTYQFRFGAQASPDNPHEILAVCPVDGYVLYCDGTVRDKDGKTAKIPQTVSH